MKRIIAAIILAAFCAAPAWALEGHGGGIGASGAGSPTLNGNLTINNQVADTTPSLNVLWNALGTPAINEFVLQSSAASNAWRMQVDSVGNGGGFYLLSDINTGGIGAGLQCAPNAGKPDTCTVAGNVAYIYDTDLAFTTAIIGPASAAGNRSFRLPAANGTTGNFLNYSSATTTVWGNTTLDKGVTSTTGAIGPSAGGVLQSYGGTVPTLSAGCNGAGVTAVTGSNSAFSFTTQTAAATTCTVTFSASGPFHAAPICGCFDAGATTTPVAFSMGAVSTSTAVIDFASVAAKKINCMCIGQ